MAAFPAHPAGERRAMKKQLHGPAVAGRRAGMVLALATCLLAGCVVTSVYPFYTDQDLVFDPSLSGTWADAESPGPSSDRVRVESVDGKYYRLTVFTGNETNGSELHLFQLEHHWFMDQFPTNRSLDCVPTHQVSKILQLRPTIRAADLNYDWLAGLLKEHPRAIRHIVLPDKAGDKGGRIVLTADTRELQRFVLKYLNDTNAWNQPSEWKRLE
jgi:hypothetical protein